MPTDRHLHQLTDDSRPVEITFVWVLERDSQATSLTIKKYLKTIGRIERHCELLVINNGAGHDATERVADDLREVEVPHSIVTLYHPCEAARILSTAIQYGMGEFFVTLPSYIQSDPDDIPLMLQAAEEGLDYVGSRRTGRIDTRREQRRSFAYNWIMRRITNVEIHDINSGLRVIRREVLEQLPLHGDLSLFLPILAARRGYRVGEVPVRHREERKQERTNWLGVYLRRGLDLLTIFFLVRFTQRPFRFFGGIGSLLLVAGGIILGVLGVERIMGEPLADRPDAGLEFSIARTRRATLFTWPAGRVNHFRGRRRHCRLPNRRDLSQHVGRRTAGGLATRESCRR